MLAAGLFIINLAPGSANIAQNVQPVNVNSQNSVQGGNNIYFPPNGSQPTTENAVKWSCANVDNRENSSVTEWYMKMFGVVAINEGNSDSDDYVKAGWNAPSVADEAINAQRIIYIV